MLLDLIDAAPIKIRNMALGCLVDLCSVSCSYLDTWFLKGTAEWKHVSVLGALAQVIAGLLWLYLLTARSKTNASTNTCHMLLRLWREEEGLIKVSRAPGGLLAGIDATICAPHLI